MTATVLNGKTGEVESKIPEVSSLVTKKPPQQIITLKYQTLGKNNLLLLIIRNL